MGPEYGFDSRHNLNTTGRLRYHNALQKSACRWFCSPSWIAQDGSVPHEKDFQTVFPLPLCPNLHVWNNSDETTYVPYFSLSSGIHPTMISVCYRDTLFTPVLCIQLLISISWLEELVLFIKFNCTEFVPEKKSKSQDLQLPQLKYLRLLTRCRDCAVLLDRSTLSH